MDMCPDGTAVAHAITCLSVITGNIDKPGGQVIARPSHGVTSYPFSTEELVKLYGADLIARLNEKRIGADVYPMVKNFRGWAQPDMVIDQVESGVPYPVKAAWIQNQEVVVDDGGKISEYRVHIKVTFILED